MPNSIKKAVILIPIALVFCLTPYVNAKPANTIPMNFSESFGLATCLLNPSGGQYGGLMESSNNFEERGDSFVLKDHLKKPLGGPAQGMIAYIAKESNTYKVDVDQKLFEKSQIEQTRFYINHFGLREIPFHIEGNDFVYGISLDELKSIFASGPHCVITEIYTPGTGYGLSYNGIQKADKRKRGKTGPSESEPGLYTAGKGIREIGFVLRNPVAAWRIGSSDQSNNISSKAVNFSKNIELKENPSHTGSQVNAFRHALWQATITAELGESIAKQAGNAHEENPYAISGGNKNKVNFPNKMEADESADLRNNEIGREIRSGHQPLNMRGLATLTLKLYHKNGLWVVREEADGSYTVMLEQLPDPAYEKAKRLLVGLDENGLPSK